MHRNYGALIFFISGLIWLILACSLQQFRALELIFPQFCAKIPLLSFGRVDAAAEALFLYGWGSCSALACGLALWSPFIAHLEIILAFFWNLAVAIAVGLILKGEVILAPILPSGLNFFLLLLALFLCMPIGLVCLREYTVAFCWWMGSFFLLPVFLFTAGVFLKEGVLKGSARLPVEAWVHEGFLWLWLGGSALAFAYYLLSKLMGTFVEQRLAPIGFWMFFTVGSLASLRIIAGGAVPAWISAAGTSSQLLLWAPIVIIWKNICGTLKQFSFSLEKQPATQFVSFGAHMFALCSIQAIILYSNSGTLLQFTDFSSSQGVLTRYGFITSIFCGAIYYFAPRFFLREWPWPRATFWHFQLYRLGLACVVIPLALGGIVQGILLNNAAIPFSASHAAVFPWRCMASGGWSLLLVSKIIFVFHFGELVASPKKQHKKDEIPQSICIAKNHIN